MKTRERRWLQPYPPHVQQAIEQLEHDPRSLKLKGKLSEENLLRIAEEYDHATGYDDWQNTTQRERNIWLDKFEKITDQWLSLMRSGPVPPENWGFPVKGIALMNIAFRLGFEIKDPSDVEAFFGQLQTIETKVDAENWLLTDSIEHYRSQVQSDCLAPQLLKKPRDQKRERAMFLITMREASAFTVAEIALIGAVIFDDEAIDERLVRRLTNNR